MHFSLKQKIAAVAATAVIIGGAGAAFGVWSSSGSGTGSAQSGTSSASGIAGVAPVAANDLYPGAIKDAFVTISNQNAYPVEVTGISAGWSRLVNGCVAGSARTDAAAPTSSATALTRSDQALTTVIAPSTSGTYKVTLRMSNDAAEACKNQTFVIGLVGAADSDMTATIRSAATTTDNSF